MPSRCRVIAASLALLAGAAVLPLHAQKLPLNPSVQRRTAPDAKNVKLVAWTDMFEIVDVSDPKNPKRVSEWTPDPQPKSQDAREAQKWRMDQRRFDPAKGEGSDLISMQDVYVDACGYMYATDYNGGLYVLQYTGPKAKGAAADPRRMWKPGLK